MHWKGIFVPTEHGLYVFQGKKSGFCCSFSVYLLWLLWHTGILCVFSGLFQPNSVDFTFWEMWNVKFFGRTQSTIIEYLYTIYYLIKRKFFFHIMTHRNTQPNRYTPKILLNLSICKQNNFVFISFDLCCNLRSFFCLYSAVLSFTFVYFQIFWYHRLFVYIYFEGIRTITGKRKSKQIKLGIDRFFSRCVCVCCYQLSYFFIV